MGRPLRQLAARAVEEVRRRAGREERAARRGGAGPRHARAGAGEAGGRGAPRAGRRGARRRDDRAAATRVGGARRRGRRAMAQHADRDRRRRATAASCRSRSNASARGSARGTRCSRARPGPTPDRAARSGCRGALPYIASMGFDVLYLPPIHPIGRSFRKGRTTRSMRARTTSAARGRSGRGGRTRRGRAVRSAPSTTSIASSRRPAGRVSRSRSTSPTRRHPIIRTSTTTRLVPAAPRRHDQVRGEPAEEVPGHLSDQLRVERVGSAVDRAEARHRVLGRRTASRSSGSTTRTPSRSGSGSGRSPRSSGSIPTPSSCPKRSPGPR